MKREPKVNVPIQLTGRPHTPSHRQSNAIPCPAQSRPSSCHESCPGLPQGGRPSSARSTPADQPETRRHSAPPGHPTSSQRRSGMSRHTAVPEPGPSRRVRMSAPRSSSPMRRQVSQEAPLNISWSTYSDNDTSEHNDNTITSPQSSSGSSTINNQVNTITFAGAKPIAATETVLSSRFDNLERMLPGSSQMLDDIEFAPDLSDIDIDPNVQRHRSPAWSPHRFHTSTPKAASVKRPQRSPPWPLTFDSLQYEMLDDIEEPEFASDISDDSDVRDPNIQLQRSRELQPSSPRSGTMGLPRRSPAQSPQRFQPSPPPTLDKLQRSPEWSPVFDLSHYEMLDDIGQPEFPPDISSEDADIVDPNIQSQRSPVVSPHRMQPSTSPAATSDQSRRSPPVAHSSPHQAARLDQTQQSSAQSPLFDLSQYEALEHREPSVFAPNLSDDVTDPHIQQQPLPAEPSPQQAPLLDRTPVRSATEQTTYAEEKRSEEQEEARFRMLQRLLQTSTGKDSYLDTIEPPPLAPAQVEDEDSSQLWQDIRDYRDDVLLPATETTRRLDLQDTDFLMSGIQRLPEFFDESSKSRTTQPAPQPASERLVAHSRPSLARRIPVPVTRQPPTAQPAAPAVRRYISTGRPVSAPQEPVAQRPVSVQATSKAHQPAHAISRPVSAQPAPSVRRPVSPRTPSAARRLVTAQTTPTSAQVTKVQPSPASVYSPVTREIRRPLSTPSRTRPQAQETRGSGIPVAFRPKIGLQTETRPTTVLPRSYDEDLTGTYIRVPRPGTVPPPSFQQRDFPFKSELSPVQPVYPYPTTQPQADILSGVPVSGPREGEVEPEFPVPSTSRQVPPIPGTSRDQPMRIDLDRKVGQYGFDDKSWHDTEVALTHLEMDLEKATEQMMRNIETALGEGVDEFQVLEALLDKGIPEETVSRTVARKYGEGASTTAAPLDQLSEETERELRYFKEIEKLVNEEAHDVDIALKFVQMDIESRPKSEFQTVPSLKLPEAQKTYALRRQLRDIRKQTQPTTIAEGEEPEEIQPEIAAAMMHTEERGLHLGDAPQHMFSYLFKTKPADSSSVDILPAQPGEAQVIPVRLSAQADTELQAAGSGMQQQQPPPDTDLHSTTVGQQALEHPPGAESSTAVSSKTSLTTRPPDSSSVDYYLEPRPPAYFNRFQLRGSQLPSWFPGYYEVMPHTGDSIRLSESPSTVLQSAWESLRPETFPLEAIILTEEPGATTISSAA